MAALPVPNGGTFGSECGTSEIEIIKNGGTSGIVKKKGYAGKSGNGSTSVYEGKHVKKPRIIIKSSF